MSTLSGYTRIAGLVNVWADQIDLWLSPAGLLPDHLVKLAADMRAFSNELVAVVNIFDPVLEAVATAMEETSPNTYPLDSVKPLAERDLFEIRLNLMKPGGERSQLQFPVRNVAGNYIQGLEFWVCGPNTIAPILQLPFSLTAQMYARLAPGLAAVDEAWEPWL